MLCTTCTDPCTLLAAVKSPRLSQTNMVLCHQSRPDWLTICYPLAFFVNNQEMVGSL